MDWDTSAMDGQFIYLRRSFLCGGGLAALWHADNGLAVSLLPVMLLLARGYPEGRGDCQQKIAWLAGLSVSSVKKAARTLAEAGVIREFQERPGGVIWYAVTNLSMLRDGDTGSKTYFPGRIVAYEAWRELRRCERAVVLALAPLARTRHLVKKHEYESWPADATFTLHAWLVSIGAISDPMKHGPWGMEAKRIGETSCSELARLTGIDRASASRAIRGLMRPTWPPMPPLIHVSYGASGRTRFHLPDGWWLI
jgi:hypothetical protein